MKTLILLLILSIASIGCSTPHSPINYGRDNCYRPRWKLMWEDKDYVKKQIIYKCVHCNRWKANYIYYFSLDPLYKYTPEYIYRMIKARDDELNKEMRGRDID